MGKLQTNVSLWKCAAFVTLVYAAVCVASTRVIAQDLLQDSHRAGEVLARSGSEISVLQQKIRDIAAEAGGKVAVACSFPDETLNCDLNADATPPMQSVFKLPLALAALHQVEQGSLSLDQLVHFGPDDRILPQTYSPLQDRYPEANVDVSLKELLRLSVSLSDNVAADILLRLVDGPKAVNDYVASIGIPGFHLEDREHDLHRDVTLQYRNWLTPRGAVQLLRRISDRSPLSLEHTALLLEWMRSSVKPRLQLALPAGTPVAHKAGTSGVATNDIGLITLPDGRLLAIAVFITDSLSDEATRERVISRIARAAYDTALSSVRLPGEGVASSLTLEDFARQTLKDADATGFIHLRDVGSGSVLAHVTPAADGALWRSYRCVCCKAIQSRCISGGCHRAPSRRSMRSPRIWRMAGSSHSTARPWPARTGAVPRNSSIACSTAVWSP